MAVAQHRLAHAELRGLSGGGAMITDDLLQILRLKPEFKTYEERSSDVSPTHHFHRSSSVFEIPQGGPGNVTSGYQPAEYGYDFQTMPADVTPMAFKVAGTEAMSSLPTQYISQ